MLGTAEVYAHLKQFRPRAIYGYEAEAKTDANGHFQFSNLSDEIYTLDTRVLLGRVVSGAEVTPRDRDVLLKVSTAPK